MKKIEKYEDFEYKYVAIWKELPKELLQDMPQIKNYLDNSEMLDKYNQLIADNNLNPEMYHPAIKFTDECNDNFVKNRISVFIYAQPNKVEVESNGMYKG